MGRSKIMSKKKREKESNFFEDGVGRLQARSHADNLPEGEDDVDAEIKDEVRRDLNQEIEHEEFNASELQFA